MKTHNLRRAWIAALFVKMAKASSKIAFNVTITSGKVTGVALCQALQSKGIVIAQVISLWQGTQCIRQPWVVGEKF